MKRFSGEFDTYPATTREFQLGYRSWQVGHSEESCPYPKGMTHRQRWFAGWIQARTDDRLQQMFWNAFFGSQEREARR